MELRRLLVSTQYFWQRAVLGKCDLKPSFSKHNKSQSQGEAAGAKLYALLTWNSEKTTSRINS